MIGLLQVSMMETLLSSLIPIIASIKLFLTFAFVIRLRTLGLVIIFFTIVMVVLLVFILIFIYLKNKHEKKYAKYKIISGLLIRKAVFFDGIMLEETLIPVTKRATKLMVNNRFRKLFTEDLITAKNNITGTSAENLKHLYRQLNLHKNAFQDLKSTRWHIKAKAIQELNLMEIIEFKDNLSPFTNHKTELVRMEAQTALIQFTGFEGLQFLDTITYSISEWQQIKLLQKLSNLPPVHIKIDDWLKSTNNSVVVFALKLARNYHHFELHDLILTCLDHSDAQVRQQAIYCLGEIYTNETSIHLISRFWREGLKHQLLIIKALKNIGSENDIPFLLTLLPIDNYEMKLAAVEALAFNGKKGLSSLNSYCKKDIEIHNISMQVKEELVA